MTGILWWMLGSALGVVNVGIYKRALAVAAAFGGRTFFRLFFMNALCIGLIGALILVAPKSLPTDLSPLSESAILVAAILSVSVSGIVSGAMSQYAYSNEKVGTLAPFAETGRILSIVAGFLFFTGTSAVSFAAALLAGIAIMAGSVDPKNFRMNRYSAVLAASGIFRAYSVLCSGWILLKIAAVPFAFADTVIATVITLFLALREGFPKFSKDSYLAMGKPFLLNDAVWFGSYLISLFLLKELGVVVASLLGMIAMVATVAYGRFVLGERPEKKTWILTAFVALCILIGTVSW